MNVLIGIKWILLEGKRISESGNDDLSQYACKCSTLPCLQIWLESHAVGILSSYYILLVSAEGVDGFHDLEDSGFTNIMNLEEPFKSFGKPDVLKISGIWFP